MSQSIPEAFGLDMGDNEQGQLQDRQANDIRNQTQPPKAQTEIDEILQKLAYELIHSIRQAQEDDWTPEETKQIQDAKIADASAKLQGLINSVIGEDDTVLPMASGVDYEAIFKNELRAEQRQRLSHIQEADNG